MNKANLEKYVKEDNRITVGGLIEELKKYDENLVVRLKVEDDGGWDYNDYLNKGPFVIENEIFLMLDNLESEE